MTNDDEGQHLRSLCSGIRESETAPDVLAGVSRRMPCRSGDVRQHRGAHDHRDRRAGVRRYGQGHPARPHLHEPDAEGLSGLQGLLRPGGDDRAHRRLLPPRRAGPGGEEADPLPAGSRRRRQVLARRPAQGPDGEVPHLRAGHQRRRQPDLRERARPVRSGLHGPHAGGPLRHSAAPADGQHVAVGGEAARRVRRRHLQVLGHQAASLQAAPDLRGQDRARRREQPGHLGAGRQGRHPQARALRPERRRRLLLLGRPQPHDAGRARVRRDVQGAAQDAAPAADRHAGPHLRRHRERRRHALSGPDHRPLQRERVAELPRQQEQRGVPRPHQRHQGALLPARRRRRSGSTRSC